jgi:hypothetical protein
MNAEGDAKELLKEAMGLDLDLIIVLGVKEEGGSIMLHNVETDLDASFLLKTFVATLEMTILEELHERAKRALN